MGWKNELQNSFTTEATSSVFIHKQNLFFLTLFQSPLLLCSRFCEVVKNYMTLCHEITSGFNIKLSVTLGCQFQQLPRTQGF